MATLPDTVRASIEAALMAGQIDSAKALMQKALASSTHMQAKEKGLVAVLPDTAHANISAAIKAGQIDSAKARMRRALANSTHPQAKKIDKEVDDMFALLALMPHTHRAVFFEYMVKGEPIMCM